MTIDVYKVDAIGSSNPRWFFEFNMGRGAIVAKSKPYAAKTSALRAVERICHELQSNYAQVRVILSSGVQVLQYLDHYEPGHRLRPAGFIQDASKT